MHCFFEHRVEHRREVAGRRIDDLQHLGRRGLLLQRLARLGQEPCVLHRDDRLRREVLQQCYLLLGKWPHFLSVGSNVPEQRFAFPQRDKQKGPHPAALNGGSPNLVIRLRRQRCHVFDLDKRLPGQ